jgi:hypothetical protein
LRRDPAAAIDCFQGLSEKDIMLKAKIAIQALQSKDFDSRDDIKFLHAKWTAGGGAILVLKTEEAAEWLRSAEVMNRFVKEFGGTAMAGAILCMVIAEYVPVSFQPDMDYAIAQLESDSSLLKGAIREARYIKKIE